MSDSFQYGDILFLGLIAVFIALRLRAMLGRSSGIHPRDIWKQATRALPQDNVISLPDPALKKPVIAEEALPAGLQGNVPVTEGLKAIKAADANFSTSEFLSGSKLAFEWLIQAFSKNDKDKLRILLSPERYQHFAADIDARANDGVSHETTLVSILAADITEAKIQGSTAQITVQFTTEQVHVSRDKDKNVVGGNPAAIERVIDIWTFERNVASRDPNWKIIAT